VRATIHLCHLPRRVTHTHASLASLVHLLQAGSVSFKYVITFNMDEYCNLPQVWRSTSDYILTPPPPPRCLSRSIHGPL
jgi:hypothetical protein